MTAGVKFSIEEEFLAELAKDLDDVHRRILRVSLRFTPSRHMPHSRHVEVVAAYELAAGAVVRLEIWTGEYMGEPFGRQALELADAIQTRVAKAATDLGLEVRPGVFDPVPAGRRR